MINLIVANEVFFQKTNVNSFKLKLDDFSSFNNENCIKRLNLKLRNFPRSNYSLLDNEYYLSDEKTKEILNEKLSIFGFKESVLRINNKEIELLKNSKEYVVTEIYSNATDTSELEKLGVLKRMIPGILYLLYLTTADIIYVLYKNRFKKTEMITYYMRQENGDYNFIYNEKENIIKKTVIEKTGIEITNILDQIKLNNKISQFKNTTRCGKCEWKNICKSI